MLPDIFGRLRKAFAAGFIHVELAQQRVAVAQAVQFAEHDVGGIVRQHQPRIMLDEIEPAAAVRLPEKSALRDSSCAIGWSKPRISVP